MNREIVAFVSGRHIQHQLSIVATELRTKCETKNPVLAEGINPTFAYFRKGFNYIII